MKSIVAVRGLTKSYDDNQVVKGIDFEVKKGEIFGILGPNGAGKTTTLEMIEALRPIDAGEVLLNGIDVAREPQRVKEIIGLQLQSSDFYDKMTLKELILMFASFYGAKVDPMALLEEVELTEKAGAYAEQLSGGAAPAFQYRGRTGQHAESPVSGRADDRA